MREDIRERIELINAGKIPDGYIKYKRQVFSEKFNITTLDELVEFQNGINAEKDSFGKGIKIISVSDILKGEPLYYDNIKGEIDITDEQLKNYVVEYGDILFQRSSENVEDAGTANIYLDKEKKATFGGFVIRGKRKNDYNPIVINEILKMQYVRKQNMKLAAGAQHINISQDALKKIWIAIPDEAQQDCIEKIAIAFSKKSKLIEKMISVKKEQKKWLMQNLLTGKKRLPNCNSEWKKVKLSKVLIEQKEKKGNLDVQICSVAVKRGVVNQMEHLGRSYAANDTSKYNVVDYGDIVYTKSPTGDFPYGIIKQSHIREKVAVSPLYGVYKAETFELGYLLHIYFQNKSNVFNYLHPLVQKGAKNTINITNDNFLKNSVMLPMDSETQKRLTDIFMTADKEIELLEKKLELLKKEKKALMQLLLTGIVRVNES